MLWQQKDTLEDVKKLFINAKWMDSSSVKNCMDCNAEFSLLLRKVNTADLSNCSEDGNIDVSIYHSKLARCVYEQSKLIFSTTVGSAEEFSVTPVPTTSLMCLIASKFRLEHVMGLICYC